MPDHADSLRSLRARKLHAPATLNNRAPILEVLQSVLPEHALVLEVGAGTGEHAVHFAAALPGVWWQPTDPDPDALASIAAHVGSAGRANVGEPFRLDVRQLPWPGIGAATLDAVVAINVIHIAPWETCCALIGGASLALKPDGLLYLYGPFKRDGRHTAVSNALFDEQLQQMNPAYGVRDLADVARLAADAGLLWEREVAMPANNLSLVLRKPPTAAD